MTAPTWANPALPLAERVELAMLDWNMDDATEAHRAALVADVAAADRLAVACLPHESEDDPADEQKAYDASIDEWDEALATYRARKAQGVNRGE